ncbi:YD repeat protein [Pseudomonas chlororaphis]|uniref:YD repeat protein n=1 Tax=Pseudomonas chlororaphis TaxID=587753 RepID=A0A3G7TTK1_9PSED|nr:RHS repeat-associated core domain-containing protein [Pseudomonas chlororaphis]AZE50360.1 YD repeat protein [Pseudomonas chlororaphis]
MNKVKSNASKNQRRALDNPVSVRANEPFLPTQPQELRENLPTASIIGFNGQLFEPISGTYLLGNGYRAYSPTMRAFYSPDSLSPFGAGGVSRYQYCNLNPVNYTDPSGHSVVGAGIGVISALSIVTGAVAIGLEVGRRVHSQSDPGYSASLRKLSIGFGIASVALGVVAGVAGVARYAARQAVARSASAMTSRATSTSSLSSIGRPIQTSGKSFSAPNLRSMGLGSPEFAGYHGSNLANGQGLKAGLRSAPMGTASALERGPGFYIAPMRNLADDFAINATISGYDDATFTNLYYAGDAGIAKTYGVYVQNYSSVLASGRQIAWGEMSGGGFGMSPVLESIEVVLRPSLYRSVSIRSISQGAIFRGRLPTKALSSVW